MMKTMMILMMTIMIVIMIVDDDDDDDIGSRVVHTVHVLYCVYHPSNRYKLN